MHVSRRPVAVGDALPRGGRAGGVVRAGREDLGGSEGELPRFGARRGLLLPLEQDARELHVVAGPLVQELELRERLRSGLGVDEARVGDDRAGVVASGERDLGELLVGGRAEVGIGIELAELVEDLDEGLRVSLGAEDVDELPRRTHDRGVVGLRHGEHAHEGGARASHVSADPQERPRLGRDPRANPGLFRGARHAREAPRGVEGVLERDGELDVARSEVVVGRVDREGGVEGLEGERGLLERVLPEHPEALQDAEALRTACVLELDPQELLHLGEIARRERRARERRGGPRRVGLVHEELRRHPLRVVVGGVELEHRLRVRQRALGLLEVVCVEVDEAEANRVHLVRGRGSGRRERRLEELRHVPVTVASDVAALEGVTRVRVVRGELQDLLEGLDAAILLAAQRLVEGGGSPQKVNFIGHFDAIVDLGQAQVGELLGVPRLREEVVEAVERGGERRGGGEGAFEVPDRAELVPEALVEEVGRVGQKLGRDRVRDALQPLALHHDLERERELRDPIVPQGSLVQRAPRLGGELAPREGEEHLVEEGLLVDEGGAQLREKIGRHGVPCRPACEGATGYPFPRGDGEMRNGFARSLACRVEPRFP